MNLLKRFSSLSPIYQGGLTNHLPMMIVALELLGVSNSSIKFITEDYVKEKAITDLHSQMSAFPITPFEQKYISLTNTYLNVINDNGIDITVKNFFLEHENSLLSGLFHGLIRLYYAIITEDELQVAQALSYFFLMSNKEALEGVPNKTLDSFDVLVEKRKTIDISFENQDSTEKFQTILNQPFVKEGIFILQNSILEEKEVLSLFVKNYLYTLDFYSLHVITGFHALYSLKGYFGDYKTVLDNFFMQAQVFMLVNSHKDKKVLSDKLLSFDSPLEIAQLEDAHDIKLLHTCRDLYDTFKIEGLLKIISNIKEHGLNY